jgi:transcription initiation factor TFIIIB Brf1 subunit/transcription initiation factor TFIIB
MEELNSADFTEGYSNRTHVNNFVQKSIITELKKYDLPEDIMIQADIIHSKMKPRVNRGKIMIQKLYYCTYNAYRELARDIDHSSLGAKFGLTPGEVVKTDSLFSPLQTGYIPPKLPTTCLEYIPGYCKNMGLSEEQQTNIINFTYGLLKKEPLLLQEPPKTIAAGIFQYYLVINGIVLSDNNNKIVEITGRSYATIDNIFNRISLIDNS